MGELLALEGPWSIDLMATMVPEAMKREAKAKKALFIGQVAAISCFLGKGEFAREYGAALDKAVEGLEELQRVRRGGEPVDPKEKAADELADLLARLPGMKG